MAGDVQVEAFGSQTTDEPAQLVAQTFHSDASCPVWQHVWPVGQSLVLRQLSPLAWELVNRGTHVEIGPQVLSWMLVASPGVASREQHACVESSWQLGAAARQ
jgi:hypothetical protein